MNLNRALTLLAKKFAVNSDVFQTCSKDTVIKWAEQIQDGMDNEKRTGINTYTLSRNQHAFLISDYRYIPMNEKHNFEF